METADFARWTSATKARLQEHARALLKWRLRDRSPHPTKIERVDVVFKAELRNGTHEEIVASAWC